MIPCAIALKKKEAIAMRQPPYESQIIDSQGAAWILAAYVLHFSAVL